MNFADPKVAAVYAAYETRIAAEKPEMDAAFGSPPLPGAPPVDPNRFLLPVGPEVGRFLHALILARRPRRILELGTSYGYSTLFLADAAREVGAQVVTMDVADYKQAYAAERIAAAGLARQVEFRLGDAVALTAADPGDFDFALLDIWKDLYLPCFEALYPKLAEEGVIVADNMIYPDMARADVRTYRATVRAKLDLQTVLLPIGSGIELSVKWSGGNGKL